LRFTLKIPSYQSYITYGPNRELREKLYKGFNTRAPENGEVIDKILLFGGGLGKRLKTF